MASNPLSDEEVADNLQIVRDYIGEWKKSLDALGIWVIEPNARLYDSIAFSLLNKAFKLSKACVRLAEEGYTDEAYGISRSIFECALNLRYMTLNPEEICARTNNYLDFFHAEREHFLELLRKYLTDKAALNDIERRARAERIDSLWGNGRPKHVIDWKVIEGREWTGWKVVTEKHPLDDELNRRCALQRFYAVFWRASSAMVHCSVRSLDNNFAVGAFAFKVGENTRTHYDHSFEPLLITVFCLYLTVRYALFGANIDSTEEFDELIESTSKRLHYRKQS
jgi:hypothetical protein